MMGRAVEVTRVRVGVLLGMIVVLSGGATFAQVSPNEIGNPRSRAAEQEYFPQLQSLQSSIADVKFPFPFKLARYLNAKPGQRAALDLNGVEFVYFQQSVVLKISGIYQAAFNSRQLSENERASRTFQDAVVPILRIVTQKLPRTVECEGIGFEIIYNTRHADGDYDYEGKEVITIVFSRDDAFSYASASTPIERQQILNRSHVFVNGKEYGLAPGKRDPFNVEMFERPVLQRGVERTSFNPARGALAPIVSETAVSPAAVVEPVAKAAAIESTPAAALNAARLQEQFQERLNELAREDGGRFHLAAGQAPSFEGGTDQAVLHFTMQNTSAFDRNTSSIYKRAAQSLDLFLAPQLRDLARKLPEDSGYDTVEFSVLNSFGGIAASNEAVDYICPLDAIHSFVQNKISTQDLINQSVVLVNGVRISLNLQLVE